MRSLQGILAKPREARLIRLFETRAEAFPQATLQSTRKLPVTGNTESIPLFLDAAASRAVGADEGVEDGSGFH
jgi:hypothetical protein